MNHVVHQTLEPEGVEPLQRYFRIINTFAKQLNCGQGSMVLRTELFSHIEKMLSDVRRQGDRP